MAIRTSTIGLATVAVAAAFLLIVMSTHAEAGDITTVAGGGVGDGGKPTLAALTRPDGLAIDSHDNVYIADGAAHRIRKIDVERNVITTLAGTGNPGFSGDEGPASAAELSWPFGLAFDDDDNLYVADSGNHRIRKIDLATGIITTVAGSGVQGFEGDDGLALYATFNAPHGVDVDRHGNVYIADTFNNRIRKIDAVDGIVTTVAGSGIPGFEGDFGLAVNANLNQPKDVAVDDWGKVYIADSGNHVIRQIDHQIDRQGVISTLAGKRNAPVDPVTVANSGPARDAVLRNPRSLALDQERGNLYVADTRNHLVRRILLNTVIEDAQITTEAGASDGSAGYDGEETNAIVSSLNSPSAVAVNSLGEVYIADTGNRRVRAIVSVSQWRPKILVTVAGNGEASFSGEDALATSATLHFPSDVALGPNGNMYFSDTDNHRVRRVDLSTGLINTVAGNGVAGNRGVGGPGTNTRLHSPEGLAFDSDGRLYIADTGNDRVLRLNVRSGVLRAIIDPASNSTSTVAFFNSPTALAVDSADNLYIAETGNHRIRMVDLDTDEISIVAGDGSVDFTGDGGRATRAKLNKPEGVAVDGDGNIVIADTGNRRIRRVEIDTEIISTIAGDGGPATEAGLDVPRRVAVDADGNVLVSDTLDHRIRAIKSDGTIVTVAGDGRRGYVGDRGPATSASLYRPLGMAFDANGNLYFADSHNNRIRMIAAPVVEQPTPTPVPPTDTPTPVPTHTPTPVPTHTPTPEPTPTPLPLPDLVPEDVQYGFAPWPVCRISPDELETTPGTYRIVVRNHGTADSGPFVVDVNGLSHATVQRLAVGAVTVVEITGIIRPGDNIVTVDVDSQVQETDEDNNTTRFALLIPTPVPPPVCTPTPTPTHTPVPPTATPTPTNTPVPPTATPTPTHTPTHTPAPPTSTPTPVPTHTPTPVPPTATPTPPPTAVPTNTSTPAPTSTATPVPPTATSTATPIVVIVTATPTPGVEVVADTDDGGTNPGFVVAIIAVVLLVIGMIAGLYVAYRRRTFGE